LALVLQINEIKKTKRVKRQKEERMKKALVLALALMTFVGLPLFAAGTPAGTQIKNQATAQYKDANG